METPAVVAAIRLLMLTGCRLGEIRTLRWEDVDLDAAELRWRDAKSGAKMIPLNGPALEVLANAVRIEGNPYVIVGAGEGAHLTDLRKPWWR
ncbi:MAG: integrase, partial [Alphaproteobacteria bacterium]|nr:integrase [Alphaproteobacteria bacterium]